MFNNINVNIFVNVMRTINNIIGRGTQSVVCEGGGGRVVPGPEFNRPGRCT